MQQLLLLVCEVSQGNVPVRGGSDADAAAVALQMSQQRQWWAVSLSAQQQQRQCGCRGCLNRGAAQASCTVVDHEVPHKQQH
jgi:hypothetical protein